MLEVSEMDKRIEDIKKSIFKCTNSSLDRLNCQPAFVNEGMFSQKASGKQTVYELKECYKDMDKHCLSKLIIEMTEEGFRKISGTESLIKKKVLDKYYDKIK